VKYAAFMPPKGETEVSVFRIDTLTLQEIWETGEMVGAVSERKLQARGDLLVDHVLREDLEVIEETSNHPLHANIEGWPSDDLKIRRIARNLADNATLFLKP